MDLGTKVVTAAPFGIAMLMYMIAPELSRLVRRTILGRLQDAGSATSCEKLTGIPAHLRPEFVGDYVEYASDATQVAATTLLTLFAMVAAIISGLPVVAALLFLMVGMPASLFLFLRVLETDPAKYVSRKVWRRYSRVQAWGIGLNGVAIVLLLALL